MHVYLEEGNEMKDITQRLLLALILYSIAFYAGTESEIVKTATWAMFTISGWIFIAYTPKETK